MIRLMLLLFIITMLWVFADFVEPTIMGSQQQPLLGIVPLDISQSDTNYKLIPKMFYYKVQQRKIRNIIISICDNYMGNVLDITKEFIITLHFKRILHYYFPETFPLIVSLKNSESHVTLNSPLNFSEYDYEVCVRDVWVSLEGWPNIRQGSNMLELYNRITNQKTYLYVRPGYYKTRYANLGAIAAPIIESTKYKTFKEVFELSSDKESYILKADIGIYFSPSMAFTLCLTSQLYSPLQLLKLNDKIYLNNFSLTHVIQLEIYQFMLILLMKQLFHVTKMC